MKLSKHNMQNYYDETWIFLSRELDSQTGRSRRVMVNSRPKTQISADELKCKKFDLKCKTKKFIEETKDYQKEGIKKNKEQIKKHKEQIKKSKEQIIDLNPVKK